MGSGSSTDLPPDLLPAVRLAGPSEAARVPAQLRVDGRVPSWDTATRRFYRLVEYYEHSNTSHRVIDYESYTSSWAKAAWNELYQIDRLASEWAEQTVLVTLTGSPFLDRGRDIFLPPMTHYQRLQDAAPARQKALSRALAGFEWQSVRTIGASQRGYPTLFLGLYLSESISPERLQPVLESHVRNCTIAEAQGHRLQSAVQVRDATDSPSMLIHGLGGRVPGLELANGLTAASWTQRALAAVLRGGQWRPYRFGMST